MEVIFEALEYTSEDTFVQGEYRFSGSTESGWTITRNGRAHLTLGRGYRLLRTLYCGICSTDLARRYMPFPLPQIIGHEAVARDEEGRNYIVEINDTCVSRGDVSPEIFCKSGLPTHCPGRMVLGIDRLPGGFAPWILVPEYAAIPIDDLPPRSAVLIEPFAAALHAVTVSPPCSGDSVAVVGAGRLGLLIVAALAAQRQVGGYHFAITVLDVNSGNLDRARVLGADDVIVVYSDTPHKLRGHFDTVFDASGTPEGLDLALAISRREVHLKSTHGREYHGIKHLTELVVDELSLLTFSTENLDYLWSKNDNINKWVYIAPGCGSVDIPNRFKQYHDVISSAESYLKGKDFYNRIPRFDIAIASSAEEIDLCIRPSSNNEQSLVKPRGAILFKGSGKANPLLNFINSGKRIRTSRCGNFKEAINCIKKDIGILTSMEKNIITHEFPVSQLADAFDTARGDDAIKVIIHHKDS
ncbi:MAG: alcohol dehydrogenase catalytic domain-containing protein [Spirochaetes bacterium]|nr:alcohol dehydrogenase catalytic domain-containing protein [Spirochaetota bacterium]